VNVTDRLQDKPAARLLPHPLVSAKFVVSPRATLEMVSVALPLLVRATVEAALVVLMVVFGKVMLVAENVALGAVPVPKRLIVAVDGEALSVMVMLLEMGPLDCGLNDGVMVQVALTARLEPQVVA
jgi:hypothetical protein